MRVVLIAVFVGLAAAAPAPDPAVSLLYATHLSPAYSLGGYAPAIAFSHLASPVSVRAIPPAGLAVGPAFSHANLKKDEAGAEIQKPEGQLQEASALAGLTPASTIAASQFAYAAYPGIQPIALQAPNYLSYQPIEQHGYKVVY